MQYIQFNLTRGNMYRPRISRACAALERPRSAGRASVEAEEVFATRRYHFEVEICSFCSRFMPPWKPMAQTACPNTPAPSCRRRWLPSAARRAAGRANRRPCHVGLQRICACGCVLLSPSYCMQYIQYPVHIAIYCQCERFISDLFAVLLSGDCLVYAAHPL